MSLARLQMMEEGLVVGRGGSRSAHGFEDAEPIIDRGWATAEPAPPPSGGMLEHRFRAVAAEARAQAAWMARSCAVTPVKTLAAMLRALGEGMRPPAACQPR